MFLLLSFFFLLELLSHLRTEYLNLSTANQIKSRYRIIRFFVFESSLCSFSWHSNWWCFFFEAVSIEVGKHLIRTIKVKACSCGLFGFSLLTMHCIILLISTCLQAIEYQIQFNRNGKFNTFYQLVNKLWPMLPLLLLLLPLLSTLF